MKLKMLRMPLGGAKRLSAEAGPVSRLMADAVDAPDAAAPDQTDGDVPARLREPVLSMRRIPWLGRKPLQTQTAVIGSLAVLSAIAASALTWYTMQATRDVAMQSEVIARAGMQVQRMAKSAEQTLSGHPGAFDELAASARALGSTVAALRAGGDADGNMVKPVGAAAMPSATALATTWDRIAGYVRLLQESREAMIAYAVQAQDVQSQALSLSADLALAQKKAPKDAVSPAEADAIGRMDSSLRLIGADLQRMLSIEAARDGIKEAMDAQLAYVESAWNGWATSRSALRDPVLRQELTDAESMQQVRNLVRDAGLALGRLPVINASASAASQILALEPAMNDAVTVLQGAQADSRAEIRPLRTAMFACGALTLLLFGVLALAYFDEARRRNAEAEQSRRQAERHEAEAKRMNDLNQSAILRLMNELQDVADGNLTVQATVSEDITGAIADSINYTVEELRDLVQRINLTAAKVAEASGGAHGIAMRLQAASDQQSRQIRETGASVLNMAAQIKQVSQSASQSAQVARQSLLAADRGHQAVQNAISGMNGIRDHIQETAKRIKRLGESSQEIGEIVELISDITEQTNLLALNAAIQAASAGEAGRGFTVVAEEVQKLAERSAEATRQISGLIKTIQTDTHDAVAAMERSTQGVVQGAKLSDQAGTALTSIGKVSRELTDLILRISQTTERQAESAESVAASIQKILLVTEQTTEGTQRTAASVHQVSELASELKNSVSRFRVE